MPTCKYELGDYKCDQESHERGYGFCTLHSPSSWQSAAPTITLDLQKDENAFKQALIAHRDKNGDNFIGFVFPPSFTFEAVKFSGKADFRDAKFTGELVLTNAEFAGGADFERTVFSGDADFSNAKFSGDADFSSAKFSGDAGFSDAEFSGKANFTFANFSGYASFWSAKFTRDAHLLGAEFNGDANFLNAKFSGDADFPSAKFSGKANFLGTKFTRNAVFARAIFNGDCDFEGARFSGETNFSKSKFFSRSLFISRKKENKIIQIFCLTEVEAEIDFTDVVIEPPDAIIFRDADLTKCRFLGTDLRKAEITNAIWRQLRHRIGVYDEYVLYRDKTDDWAHVESLYRQLKQNYEDRKDYERARDFHYGEKEMRRRNPKTSRGLRFLLTLYWAVSGYGERLLRPLLWAVAVLVVSTSCYLRWGLLHFKAKGPVLDPLIHWWDATFYGLRVMTLLKPDNLEPVRLWGDFINIAQSLLGPLLLSLFILAIRQRLKR